MASDGMCIALVLPAGKRARPSAEEEGRGPASQLDGDAELLHRSAVGRQVRCRQTTVGKENLRADDAPASRLDLKERLADPKPNVSSPAGRRCGVLELGCSVFPNVQAVQETMAALAVPPAPHMARASGDKFEIEGALFPWMGGYDAIALCDLIHAEEQGSTCLISRDFLTRHPDITSAHRKVLINWLVEVDTEILATRYQGAVELPRLLFLAVQILDRFLAKTDITVSRANLQLVGVMCYCLAAKNDLDCEGMGTNAIQLCADAFTKTEALNMEVEILKTLDWVVASPRRPLPVDFVDYFISATKLDAGNKKLRRTFRPMSHCILEATLLSSQLAVLYKPSVLAASAVLLAQRRCGMHGAWSPELELLSGCSEEQLKMPVSAINKLLSRWELPPAGTAPANQIQKRYSSVQQGRVANMLCQAPPEEGQ